MNRRLLLAITLVTLGLVGSSLRAQAVTVTYDTFMQLDANERLERFPQLTADNQAALVREQAVRWGRLHADTLTPEQQQVLAEVVASIRPASFTSKRHSSDEIAAFMKLQAKVSSAFRSGQAYEAFTLQGRHLPSR